MSAPDRDDPEHVWIAELKRWHADGTFDRMDAAAHARTPVYVKRSSGHMQVGRILGGGHAGRSVTIEWTDPELGSRCKVIPTKVFLAFNPSFDGSLEVCREAAERAIGDAAAESEARGPGPCAWGHE